jgi:NMD protein affecting ribosome stability and mRNA decay
MSLIKCRDCGQPVSETAKVCPACAAKDPTIIRPRWEVRVAAAIVMLVVLYFLTRL